MWQSFMKNLKVNIYFVVIKSLIIYKSKFKIQKSILKITFLCNYYGIIICGLNMKVIVLDMTRLVIPSLSINKH